MSVALRPDSLRLGRERRRHWPILVAGSALLAFAAIAIVATQGRSVEPKVAPPTAAAVGFAPEDGAVPVEIAPDAAAIAEATAHEVTTPDRDPETRAGVRSPSVKRHGATRKKAAEPEPERIVEQAKLDPGMLSLDVNPVSRVYIDGVFIDETPLFQHRVSAGRHELRIVPTQGDAKTVRVTIESGRVLNLGTLKL